jgi:endoglycosylceramidase
MVNIVNKAGESGIYTLVEYHQDLLSEMFCGDGVPIWLVL